MYRTGERRGVSLQLTGNANPADPWVFFREDVRGFWEYLPGDSPRYSRNHDVIAEEDVMVVFFCMRFFYHTQGADRSRNVYFS